MAAVILSPKPKLMVHLLLTYVSPPLFSNMALRLATQHSGHTTWRSGLCDCTILQSMLVPCLAERWAAP